MLKTIERHKEIHKELHKKIWNCKQCLPITPGSVYCNDCQKTIIDFMNENGAGVLCNDIRLDELVKENSKLKIKNESLSKQLEDKIKKYEDERRRT